MKKAEALQGIKTLALEWAHETGVEFGQKEMPSFSSFRMWCDSKGYGRYLDFRSTEGALAAAESEFDNALGQRWRN